MAQRPSDEKAIAKALHEAAFSYDIGLPIPALNSIVASLAQTDYIDRLRAHPTYLIRSFIENYKLVSFDYKTTEVVFEYGQIKAKNIVGSMDEADEEEKADAQTYIETFFRQDKDWFNILIFPGVHTLKIRNKSGFNPDSRSHVGDHPPPEPDKIGARVSIASFQSKTPCKDEREVFDSDDETEERKEYYRQDAKLFTSKAIKLSNSQGLTWGSLIQGVLMVKGSKSDWNYEMITDVKAKCRDGVLDVTIECDHGS